jgi:hypothetical protein
MAKEASLMDNKAPATAERVHSAVAGTRLVVAEARLVVAGTHSVVAEARSAVAKTHCVVAEIHSAVAATRLLAVIARLVTAATHWGTTNAFWPIFPCIF